MTFPTAAPLPTSIPTVNLGALSDTELNRRASTVTFAQLARNPNTYEGILVQVRGKVTQIIGSGSRRVELLIAITPERIGNTTFWDDPIYVRAERTPNLLEDDIVVVYGRAQGLYSYRTVLGAERTVPRIDAVRVRLDQPRN